MPITNNVILANSSGSVGIGTYTPTQKLDVIGNTYVSGRLSVATTSTAGTGITIGGSTVLLSFAEMQQGGIFYFYNSGNTTNTQLSQNGTNFYINATGNVGISTTSPTLAKLQVQGNVWAQSFTGSFSGSAAAPGSNTQVIFNSSGSLAASSGFVFTGANVGIGTTSPPQKLQVVDSTTFTSINVYNNRGSSGGTSSIMLGLNDGAFVTNDAARMEARVVGNPNSALDFKVYGSSLNTIMTLLGTGNVGIGTATPAAKLSVELSGAANQRLANFRNTGGNSFIEIQSSGTGAIGFWTAADNSFSIYQNATAGTIGTSVLYVSSSTNVGIGTTAPGDKLTVYGAANAPLGTRIINATNGTAAYSYLSIGVAGSAINIFSYPSANSTRASTAYINTDSSVTNGLLVTTDAGPIRFSAASTAGGQLYINTSGNVGIGTTSPTAQLEIKKSAQAVPNILLSGPTNYDGSDFKGLAIANYFSDGAANRQMVVYNPDYLSYPYLRFVVANLSYASIDAVSGSSATSKDLYLNGSIYITSGSNVGIGTTNPVEKLDVNGKVKVGTRLALSPSVFGYNSTWKTLILGSTGSNYLTDAVTITFGVDISSNPGGSYTGDGRELIFRNLTSFITPNEANTDYRYLMQFNSGSVYLVPSFGNVGIGTTAPGAKLTVRGGNIDVQESGYGLITNELKLSDYNTGIFTDGTNGNMTFSTYGGGTGNTFRWVTNVAGTNPHPSGGTTRMVMDKGGNVGIGTTSPVTTLHVSSSAAEAFRITGGTVNGLYSTFFNGTIAPLFLGFGGTLSATATNNDGVIRYNASYNLIFTSDGTERMRLNANGNLGIGTTTPAYKLEVSGETNSVGGFRYNAVPVIFNSSTDVYANIRVLASYSTFNDGMYINYNSSGSTSAHLRFYANATNERMRIDAASGNVGIATNSPTLAKLQVQGNVWAESFTGSFSGSVLAPGSNTQVIYNSGGAFAASSNFIFDGTNVGIGTTSPTSRFEINNGSATTSAFYANIGNPSSTITLFEHSGSNTPVPFRLRKTGYSGAALNYGLLYLHMNDNTVGNGSALYFTLNDSLGNEHEYGGIGAVIGANTNGAENGHLYFMTSDAGTNRSEKMRILSNGNVGIGTTTPASKLEIYSGSGDNYIYTTNGTAATFNGLMIRYNNTNYMGAIGNPSSGEFRIGGFNVSGYYTTIYSNNSETVRVTAGNVGIGTTSPGAKLEVYNGDIWLNAASSGVNPEIRFIDDSGIAVAGAKIRYGNNDGNLYIEHVYNEATSGIFFRNRTSGTTLNTLSLVNGNIGIGTTSPTEVLDVYKANNTSWAPRIVARDAAYASFLGVYNGLPGVFAHNSALSAWATLYLNTVDPTSAGNSANVLIGGNVGIGTSSPNAKLQLADGGADWATSGTIGTTLGSMHLSPSNNTANYGNAITFGARDSGPYTSAHAGIYVRSGGSFGTTMAFGTTDSYAAGAKVSMFINESGLVTISRSSLLVTAGSVGIGTTSAAYNLDILATGAGVIRVKGGSTGYTQANILLQSSTTDAPEARGLGIYTFNEGTDATWYFGNPYTYGDYFQINRKSGTTYSVAAADPNDAKNFVSINNVGNVGINILGPTEKVHVSGSIYVPYNVDAGFLGFSYSDNFETAGVRVPQYGMRWGNPSDGSGNVEAFYSGYGGIRMYTAGTLKLKIDSGGNIGLGPSTGSVGTLELTATSQGSPVSGRLSFGTDGTGWQFRIAKNQAGTKTDYFTIQDNGNVGIGTTGPTRPLHLYKSSAATEAYIQSDTAQQAALYFKTTGNAIYVPSNSSTEMRFFVNSGDRLTIDGSGNVGIGTTIPQTKLQIVNNVSGGGFASYGSYQILLYQAGSAANSYGIGIESNTMMFNSDNYYKFYVDNVAKVYIDNTGTITAAGDLIAYGSPSDITLKTNIKPLQGALEKITKLQGVSFTWKDSEQTKMTGFKDDIGFIAQEVKEILPELVRENDNGLLSLRDKGIVPYLVEAIKEQQKQIDELRYLLKKQ